jgi:hypothetical protein
VGVQKALQGRISSNGRRLTIDIPADLQQPAPGTFSALLQLSGSFERSAKRNGRTFSFVSTTSCPRGRQWATRTTFYYVGNPEAPPVGQKSDEVTQRCR